MRIEDSDLFEPIRMAGSELTSHVLRRPEGWWLQSFYFTNPSLGADGRYLWCYCMRAPGEAKQLAVADLERGELRIAAESRFGDASPMIDPRDGCAYWMGGRGLTELCRLRPEPGSRIEVLNRFPPELLRGRRSKRIATHLTFSADRRAVCFDAEIRDDTGVEWHAGLLPLDGSPAEPWASFDICYNHAQCSPVDPGLMLIAQDFWSDPVSGERHHYRQRIWLLARDGSMRPLFSDPTPKHGHEWWAPRGDAIWYVHYGQGVRRYNLATGRVEAHWGGHILHAHCDPAERLLVGDTWNRSGEDPVMGVAAYDLSTGSEICIAPPAPLPDQRGHLHPHPQFTACGRYVAYTAFTTDGRCSLALVTVAALRERLVAGSASAVLQGGPT